MTERFLHHVRVEWPAAEETVAGARTRLADKFPRTALRRMTHLGLLVGSTLDGLPLGPEDALVYATTFAETRALEDFLSGFPAASPLLFQTSIHPGGVQQVLIGRSQPIARLWPLASRTRLVEQALLTALLEPAGRVALVGGEEAGTWMLAHGMAAARPFAFAVSLTREPAGGAGAGGLHPGRGARGGRADAGEFRRRTGGAAAFGLARGGRVMDAGLVVSTVPEQPRNPGPSWGYGFLLWAERWWPRWFFRPLLMAGTWIGLAGMPGPRAHSRAYLAVVLGRPPRLIEVWRHFLAFADSLMLKLRAGRGVPVRCVLEPEHRAEFEALLDSGHPALFGTFHFGDSDLLGYLLGERGRRVTIIRQRVGNSTDTQLLGQRFGGKVSFLWVNDPAHLLFDLKSAIEAGESLALKCDRLEFSARAEPFRFLGAMRQFPFTIYHLAVMFDRPVAFCLAVPGAKLGEIQVQASTVFTPDPAAGREANLGAARNHFQSVLDLLEGLVRRHPFLWFNFGPLNPVAPGPR